MNVARSRGTPRALALRADPLGFSVGRVVIGALGLGLAGAAFAEGGLAAALDHVHLWVMSAFFVSSARWGCAPAPSV